MDIHIAIPHIYRPIYYVKVDLDDQVWMLNVIPLRYVCRSTPTPTPPLQAIYYT